MTGSFIRSVFDSSNVITRSLPQLHTHYLSLISLLARNHDLFVHPDGSFFLVTPPMCCLDIVGMIVAPRTSHAFGIFVIGNDIVVVREFEMADCAYAALLPNLPVQQLPHLGGRSQFPVSARMARVFDPLDSQSDLPWLGKRFPSATGNRSVNWAKLIGAQSHDFSPDGSDRAGRATGSVELKC
jgi:hypothetical protein